MLKKFGKWYLYALGAFAVFAMIAGLSGATKPDAQFKRAQQSNDTALMKKISDRNPDLIIGGEKASTIVTRLEEKQKAEAEKIAKEKAEAEKIAKEKAETERLKKEKLAKELAIAKSNGYNSYAEYQKAEAERLAKKKKINKTEVGPWALYSFVAKQHDCNDIDNKYIIKFGEYKNGAIQKCKKVADTLSYDVIFKLSKPFNQKNKKDLDRFYNSFKKESGVSIKKNCRQKLGFQHICRVQDGNFPNVTMYWTANNSMSEITLNIFKTGL